MTIAIVDYGMGNLFSIYNALNYVGADPKIVTEPSALQGFQGERNWLMACAKISELGQLEARYRRMRRVLRVITAATLSSLMRSVSTCALANAVPCKASARSRSIRQ